MAVLAGLLCAAGLATAVTTAAPASASTRAGRLSALQWAETQQGAPYRWGGTGPYWSGYDCSGLVMEAYLRAGIHLPRTTYEMLASGMLIPESFPRRGDLAFYGSGHVELAQMPYWHRTFGAHSYGEPVSSIKYGYGWSPTMFFRVRGAG